MKTLSLEKFRGRESTLFTGRTQGMDARKELNLDALDKSDEQIQLIVPSGTTSFNPSFYLGLLFESIKDLGLDGFQKKYTFDIKDETQEVRDVLRKNLNDGLRYALNNLQGLIGFEHLINKPK